MMYKIIVERHAGKEIESLPKEIIQRIIVAIEGLKSNPRPNGVKNCLAIPAGV